MSPHVLLRVREDNNGARPIVWGLAFGSLALWLIGITFGIGGPWVSLLLVAAILGIAYRLMGHRPSVG